MNHLAILKEQHDMVMGAFGLSTIGDMLSPQWFEGVDHVPTPDTRTHQEIAEEEAREEVASSHAID